MNLYRNLLPDSTAEITSAEDFINKLRHLKIKKKDILVSFDIENMHSTIDKEEMMKIVNRKIEEKFGINKISKMLISTSNLVINENHFVFGRIH